MTAITTVNPATGLPIGTYPRWTRPPSSPPCRRARPPHGAWGRKRVADRAKALSRLADHLRGEKERYAALITAEMGKPIEQARGLTPTGRWRGRRI